MTQTQRITLLAQAMGVDVKTLTGKIGNLANLTTTEKTNLVGALNELKAAIANATGINDTASSTASTYSSSKINSLVTAAVAALVDSSPTTLDTLKELATAIGNDPNYAATITAALGKRVSVDAQTFTAAQQTQARANIGAYGAAEIGDPDHDYAADYTAAKTA